MKPADDSEHPISLAREAVEAGHWHEAIAWALIAIAERLERDAEIREAEAQS